MDLIVYTAEHPFFSLVSIMATITLVKDIFNYLSSPYIIENTFSFFRHFYSDSLYIADSMKALTLSPNMTIHPLVSSIYNIVSLQITSFLYISELALKTLIKTAILTYDLSSYMISIAENTYNHIQSYDYSPYTLDSWVGNQKEYAFDFTPYYNTALSFLFACSVFAVYRYMVKKGKQVPVEPQVMDENPPKELVKRRRSPRLAMLYLTDHTLSSSR